MTKYVLVKPSKKLDRLMRRRFYKRVRFLTPFGMHHKPYWVMCAKRIPVRISVSDLPTMFKALGLITLVAFFLSQSPAEAHNERATRTFPVGDRLVSGHTADITGTVDLTPVAPKSYTFERPQAPLAFPRIDTSYAFHGFHETSRLLKKVKLLEAEAMRQHVEDDLWKALFRAIGLFFICAPVLAIPIIKDFYDDKEKSI